MRNKTLLSAAFVLMAVPGFGLSLAGAQESEGLGSINGDPVKVAKGGGAQVSEGDTLTVEGPYAVEDGASVTLEDRDGTIGTLTDGENAEFEAKDGKALVIRVTKEPTAVAEGNEVLNNRGLKVKSSSDVTDVPGGTTGGLGETTGGLEETTGVPEETTVIPEETTVIPEETTVIPEETTVIPEETTVMPEETTVMPEETTAIPEITAAPLGETTSVPEETTVILEKTTVAPEPTSAPEETTIVQEQTTVTPEETTAVPEEEPVTPAAAPPAPEETTAAPEETTAILEETTAIPEETTAMPEETTAVPEETTAVPEETTEVAEPTDCSDPETPLAGETPDEAVSGDADVSAGDRLRFEGEYEVAEGGCVVLEDGDGTQGTFRDGENAEMSEGSVIIEVLNVAQSVSGGDGVLVTEGLTAVDSEGVAVAAAPEPTVEEPKAVQPPQQIDFGASPELPETGGSAVLMSSGMIFAGAFLAAFAIIRRR